MKSMNRENNQPLGSSIWHRNVDDSIQTDISMHYKAKYRTISYRVSEISCFERIKHDDFRPIEFFSIDENETVSNQKSNLELNSTATFYPEVGFLRMF